MGIPDSHNILTSNKQKKKKSILIIPQNIPFPLDQGGNISQYAILISLQKHLNITLVLAIHYKTQFKLVTQLKIKLAEVNILIIDLTDKNFHINRFILFRNARKLLNILKYRLNLVNFINKRKVKWNKSDEFDDIYKLQPVYLKSKEYVEALSKIIEKNFFDIIQVEFFELLDLVHIIPQKSKSVFVHHEIRYERLNKSSRINHDNKKFKDYIININKNIELSLLSKYDCIITFSENDRTILQKSLANRIEVIPFPVLEEEFNFKEIDIVIDKIIFIGTDEHYPNKDGFEWFVDEVYDEIWNKFHLPFFVIGNWSREIRTKYLKDKRIIFTGYVNDLSPYYRNSISIVPIRTGSGIRAKILYAMANKSPVISSLNGVEGINVYNNIHFLKAENKNDYLVGICRLVEDNPFLKKMIGEAFNYVLKTYHPNGIISRRLELYSILTND